jgi:hypothetical protein
MEPKYVTFEQAKWLKEKRFDYHEVFQDFANYYDYHDRSVQGRLHVSDFSEDKFPDDRWIAVPEQWQVIEWLRVNHDIWIAVMPDVGMDLIYTYKIYSVEVGVERCLANGNNYDTPQEAYSAAFDYIKDNNLI